METAEDVLKECTIEGNIVKLPTVQLRRDLYVAVKKRLELIGGQWKSGKVQGFLFQQDPTELLADVANGGSRNIQKELQFFPTPDIVADFLVKLSQIHHGHKVLEPSAGQGAIAKAIYRAHPKIPIYCYEISELNQKFLKQCINVIVMGNDFFDPKPGDIKYDRIIANPPFSKNQDIDHIYAMYDILKPGGLMVTLASRHWEFAQGKKEKSFRGWLIAKNATVESLPMGTFKESGTNIESRIITIFK